MKVLVISDDPIESGYGRISVEINRRLVRRGVEVMAFGIPYDGLLPPRYHGEPLPYWVAAGGGKEWVSAAMGVIAAIQPDVVHVIQDAPYAEALRNAPVDWSRYSFVVTTPVDGAPIRTAWVNLMKGADAALSISQFGVDAYRKAGVPVTLCRPGVDTNAFYRLSDAERLALRARAGIAPEAFVFMSAMQNQGRKDIPHMMEAFFRFASDKADARYILDCEPTSPAGWDLPDLCAQNGWDATKIIFREALVRAGITELRERFNLADVHAVISHREGYGLPLVEAQACGVVSMALDYCSGTEICGDGKGALIKPASYMSYSTWGGAFDCHPDVSDMVRKLQDLCNHPHARRAIAERGMAWARQQTWDTATDAVFEVYQRVMQQRASIPSANVPPQMLAPIVQPAPQSVDGIALLEELKV